MEKNGRRLMFHGICLFLLGLLTGFAEQHFANVRMGLAAHLEGVMNGTFLLALGAVWTNVRLAPSPSTIAFWPCLRRSSGLQPFLQLLEWVTADYPGKRVLSPPASCRLASPLSWHPP